MRKFVLMGLVLTLAGVLGVLKITSAEDKTDAVQVVHATWPQQTSVEQMYRDADLVIVGRVSKVKATIEEAPTSVYTVFDVQVLEAVKGMDTVPKQITMIQFGGTGSKYNLVADNSPLANVEATYLLFLTKDKFSTEERYAVLGGSQGRLVVAASGVLEREIPLSAQQGAVGKSLAEIKQRLRSN